MTRWQAFLQALRDLFRRGNPMMRHPGYAVLTKAIDQARRDHKPTRHLLEQRKALVHRALAHSQRRTA